MNSFFLLAQAGPNDNGAAAGGIIGGFLALGMFFWILAIAATIFWLWMLVDALVSNKDTNEKILWVLVVFFLHVLGALIYFFVGRSPRGGTVTSL